MNAAAGHHPQDEQSRRRGTVQEQAADWLSRRDRGFLSGEQAEFSAWLLEDPRHAAAVTHIDAAWRFLQKPQFSGQTEEVLQEIEHHVKKRTRRRRVAWVSTLGLAAAAAIVIAFFPSRPNPAALSVAAGSVQMKPDRQILPDGSVVELNAGAEIAIEFTPAERNVRMLRGTGLFTVQKNPARPFVVITGGVSVRAVGTEFCVRFDPNELDVLVTEGRIAVERAPSEKNSAATSSVSAPAFVNADHRLSLSWQDPAAGFQIRAVPRQAVQAALAWRTMRVEFTEVPLKEIARVFNDVNAVRFEVTPAVANLRISGIYWLDDPKGFSRLVESSAGLRAIHRTPRNILLTQP